MFSGKKDLFGTLLGAIALTIPFILVMIFSLILKISIIYVTIWIAMGICQCAYLTSIMILFYDRDQKIKKLEAELKNK